MKLVEAGGGIGKASDLGGGHARGGGVTGLAHDARGCETSVLGEAGSRTSPSESTCSEAAPRWLQVLAPAARWLQGLAPKVQQLRAERLG